MLSGLPLTTTRFPRTPAAYMFGEGGMVTGVLNKDVEENTGGFERASAPLIARAAAAGSAPLTTIGDVLAAEIGAIGADGARKAKKKSAVVCALWVSRALLFVGRFGARLITTPNSKPADIAKSVYDEVLRPYHGFLVSNVVALAFSFAPCVSRAQRPQRVRRAEADRRRIILTPLALALARARPSHFRPRPRSSREDFFKRMSTAEEEARSELDAFVRIVLPTVEALNAFFVAQGYNFADKA